MLHDATIREACGGLNYEIFHLFRRTARSGSEANINQPTTKPHRKHLRDSSSIGGATVDVSGRPVVASFLIVGSEGVRGVWMVFLDQSPRRKGVASVLHSTVSLLVVGYGFEQ
ncbi:unnamed protein product [Lactuca virosa]|uniref:Uncharacterized protein n=1 Tax=Lactuca virosa TaxID=75947 RepID=A0AAU9LV80_9ASTR|nr:unnamed protein product [Lactuca virosa]